MWKVFRLKFLLSRSVCVPDNIPKPWRAKHTEKKSFLLINLIQLKLLCVYIQEHQKFSEKISQKSDFCAIYLEIKFVHFCFVMKIGINCCQSSCCWLIAARVWLRHGWFNAGSAWCKWGLIWQLFVMGIVLVV